MLHSARRSSSPSTSSLAVPLRVRASAFRTFPTFFWTAHAAATGMASRTPTRPAISRTVNGAFASRSNVTTVRVNSPLSSAERSLRGAPTPVSHVSELELLCPSRGDVTRRGECNYKNPGAAGSHPADAVRMLADVAALARG